MRMITFVFAAVLCLPTLATAQDTPGQIIVTGVGYASAPPDMAIVRVEVAQTARDRSVVMDEVADVVTKILATARTFGATDDDIESTRLSLSEEWEFVDDTRTFKGYEATSRLTIEVTDLARVGDLVAALTEDGATEIRGPNFVIDDPSALRDEARRNAVRDGVATAKLLAEAAGVSLGPPLLITDGTEPSEVGMAASRQMEEPMMMEEPVMEAVGGSTESGVPVIPGEIEVMEIARLIFRIDP